MSLRKSIQVSFGLLILAIIFQSVKGVRVADYRTDVSEESLFYSAAAYCESGLMVILPKINQYLPSIFSLLTNHKLSFTHIKYQ